MKTLAPLSTRFLAPGAPSVAALFDSLGRSLVALGCGLLALGCSGDLEDKDDYESQVTVGLGAKGVTAPQGGGQTPGVTPSVTPPTPPTTSTSPTTSTAPTTTTPPTPTTPSGGLSAACADVETRIFQTRCDGAPCHGEPGSPTASYSDFVNPTDLPAAVRDVPAKGNCTTLMLVDSQNPANSALLKVITTSPQPCTSLQMPVGDPLTTEEAACVTEWVNAVASGAI